MASDAPDDLARWSLHCYCLGARRTPHETARRHGRLLHALSEAPRAAAEVGAEARQELEAMRLAEVRDGALRVVFPVLGPERIGPVRARMTRLAQEVARHCAPAIREVAAELGAAGFAPWTPALLLGHVFDGLLWSRLRGPLDLPDTQPTVDRPDWRGTFWAVWPPVPGAIGTNEVRASGVTLALVWCEENDAALKSLRAEAWLPEALAALRDGTPPPPEAIGARIFDAKGRPAIPCLRAGTALSDRAETLADRAADRILADRAALDALPGVDLAASRVIALHELIWALPPSLDAAGAGPMRGVDGYPHRLETALFARLT